MRKPKLIIITGPTASGKSELGIKLAKKFNGEIVSADSRQIYWGMDIGTGKTQNQESIPHHGIDIADPAEEFTVAQYQKFAVEKIQEIHTRGKTPFLVGGTGLYIQSIVDNLEIPKVPPSKALREKLEKKSEKELWEDLQRMDPKTAETLDSKNKQRLIRALEVKLLSGISFVSAKKIKEPYFDNLQIAIKIPREKLYKNIDRRVEQMIEQGLEEEVKSLSEELSQKIPEEKIWSLSSLSGIGYFEFKKYFENKIDLEEVVRLIKLHSRQYARRQMTWFKRDKRIHWIEGFQTAEKLISEFLKKY